MAEIIDDIQTGKARYRGIDWPTNSKWLVTCDGVEMLAVYNGREKRIVTFLTMKK